MEHFLGGLGRYLSLGAFAFTLGFLGTLASCSKGSPLGPKDTPPAISPQTPALPSEPVVGTESEATLSQKLQNGEVQSTLLKSGASLLVEKRGNQLYHRFEGVLSDDAWAILKRTGKLKAVLRESVKSLNSVQGSITQMDESLGYFSGTIPYTQEVLSSLRTLELPAAVVVAPILHDPDLMKNIRAVRPQDLGLVARGQALRGTELYSGLAKMRVPEFETKLRSILASSGSIPDGSSVKLGIADTGIAFAHPAFGDRQGKSRVIYMKDFTSEGRAYVAQDQSLQVKFKSQNSRLEVQAPVILSPKVPQRPLLDRTSQKSFEFDLSPELYAHLEKHRKNLRLGVFFEDSFQGEGDVVDLNQNGKLNDEIPFLVLMPESLQSPEKAVVYINFRDFENLSKASPQGLRDFNLSGQVVEVFAEEIGLTFTRDLLIHSETERPTEVLGVSLVGYDPGNHGSHVAGIAGGRKIIANDRYDSLARGVAPNAQILMNRVCSNNAGCSASQAIIDLAINGNADVINMSLGGLSPFNDGLGVQESIINRLTFEKNVLFVISAGNSGPGRQTVGSPSVARLSLSVGAAATRGMNQRQYQWPAASMPSSPHEDDDFLLFFTSRGPTASGGFKPNLVGPGTELSAVQLNTAPGSRGGLDIYWGTSMSAPAVAGAYALLLDSIRKYNQMNPSASLTTNARILREILIATARPFDVTSFDTQTKMKRKGQYTWIDQGTGMIDLVAAWDQVLAQAGSPLPGSVIHEGKAVDLDYQLLVSQSHPTTGVRYDGSRLDANKQPAFGTGIYLDFFDTDTLRSVHVRRILPLDLEASEAAGRLTRQLVTTQEEFELRTVIHGSDHEWLKAGVLDSLEDDVPCAQRVSARLSLLGRGAEVSINPDTGAGSIVPLNGSALNFCFDRKMIAKLPPGDHGALIYAYRKVEDRVAQVPSFIVPVYLTVPNHRLAKSQGYELQKSVESFGVDRNFIMVPPGIKAMTVTLEIPKLKRSADGLVEAGEKCGGVELMSFEGLNTARSHSSRAQARIANCDNSGRPRDTGRILTLHRNDPRPGVWDLHVFGMYKFPTSNYELKVHYIRTSSSIAKITGGVDALTGSFEWSILETSRLLLVTANTSKYSLQGLLHSGAAIVRQDEARVIPDAAGNLLRTYDSTVKSVTLTTGESSGNDLDLIVRECPPDAANVEDPACMTVGSSGGPVDQESVTFKPNPARAYAMIAIGYAIKDEGTFTAGEKLELEREEGNLSITTLSPQLYRITYQFSELDFGRSLLLKSTRFTSGLYQAYGSLELQTSEGLSVDMLPVLIQSEGGSP
jgi:subtilisin family serine protease